MADAKQKLIFVSSGMPFETLSETSKVMDLYRYRHFSTKMD